MRSFDIALVTGCPGWLGNRLLEFLVEPHPDYPSAGGSPRPAQIRCLVAPGSDTRRIHELAPEAEIVLGDVRDRAAVERFANGAEGAVCFHLVGVIHPRRIRELYEVNVEGTKNVIAAARGAGVRRLVGISSNSPAGVSRDPNVLFDESTPYAPYLNYGRSKKLMEDELNRANGEGLETVILRPCWFYGPEQPPRQTTFFKMIKAGKAPLVGGGTARRSMSYVDNTALAILLAASVEHAAGQTYWIADERPYTMAEIVTTVADVMERDFGISVSAGALRLPSIVSETALVADALLQRVGLYSQQIHVLGEMNKTIACSIAKARDELGYRPAIGLREGMRRSIEWCLTHGQTI